MKSKLIIFDCFGVIFEEIAPTFFRRHFPEETALRLKEKFFVGADMGEVTLDELFENMSRELNMDKNDIISQWQQLTVLKKEMPPIIEALGKKYDIALLSNAPLGFVEDIMEKNNLTRLFDKMFISCNLKMAKPDPEIYKHCLSAFDGKYDEIYMIDDNEANLAPLKALGIRGIRFESPEKMLKELGETL